ncbi:MAG: hypothetical protein OXI44_08295, partial [Bacteroidota bacterium]|nr:hypothetical protein [Bacteroidota bacterium]
QKVRHDGREMSKSRQGQVSKIMYLEYSSDGKTRESAAWTGFQTFLKEDGISFMNWATCLELLLTIAKTTPTML